MPSLDDWEKHWKQNPQKIATPTVVQVDFQGQPDMAAGTESEAAVAMTCQAGG